jgi:hypothetical protein
LSDLLNGESAAWATAAELMVLCLAGFIFFRRRGNTFAEASAYGLVTTLMTLSFLLQLSFLVRMPDASLFFEIPLTLLASGYALRHRIELLHGWTAVRALYSGTPLLCIAIGLPLVYLALQALIIPPTANYWQPLGQVMEYDRQLRLFTSDCSGLPTPFSQTFSPINLSILPHLFLRFQTDLGIGLLGFMAYLAIGFSVYALSRRYAWPPTAAMTSIIVISMPRLVYLSTSPGYEIIQAATALFCFLTVFRAVESPNLPDLYLLVLGILFMISGTFMNLIFPLVLAPLACILLFRRHGATTWWKMIVSRPYLMLMFFIPAAIFSQLWLLSISITASGNVPTSPISPPVVFNGDGIQGALANASRYALQSIHFTRPVDSLLNWSTGFSLTGALQKINDNLVSPIFGSRGAAASGLRISWIPDEKLSWFGPFGFFLILPAVGYAVMRAPRRLKAVSVALIGYIFLVSLIPAWRPENVCYFDVFFVCGSICIAFFLPPWRLSKRRRRILVIISAGLLLYAGMCNNQKPAFGFLSGDADGRIWPTSGWSRDHSWAARETYGDERLETVRELVTADNYLWLIYTDYSLAYPFLLAFPNARSLSAKDVSPGMTELLRKVNARFVMFIDSPAPPWIESRFGKRIWSGAPGRLNQPGSLFHLDRPPHIKRKSRGVPRLPGPPSGLTQAFPGFPL